MYLGQQSKSLNLISKEEPRLRNWVTQHRSNIKSYKTLRGKIGLLTNIKIKYKQKLI